MPVTKVSVEAFLERSGHMPILDVRSPGEYSHAHIPGALSLPLFSDEERKQVGTTYKQVSREDAIKAGLDFFGPKMRAMVEFAEQASNAQEQKSARPENQTNTGNKGLLVHCWRGGMRSGAVAWLLGLYGFDVYVLEGGYKAFRNWVLEQFRKDYNFRLIGGYTGSGKTLLLQELARRGRAIVDLEAIARHKGSAFGGLDKLPQPSTEQFENTLAFELYGLTRDNPQQAIWVEDESQRIGDLNMPIDLWNCFRTKPLLFIDIPFEKRLDYLVADYGHHKTEQLINAIVRIKKRLGGLETKTAINCLVENDLRGCFAVLLHYYDKHYKKALANRPYLTEVIRTVEAASVDTSANVNKLLSLEHEPTGNQ